MEKALADAFLDFYHNMLKPEFDAIKMKQAEHDERFNKILKRFPLIHQRLDRCEDELLIVSNRLNRLEVAMDPTSHQ